MKQQYSSFREINGKNYLITDLVVFQDHARQNADLFPDFFSSSVQFQDSSGP